MKYAIIQVAESNFVMDANGEFPFIRGCFKYLIEFNSLEEATRHRDTEKNPEWFIIIQVW